MNKRQREIHKEIHKQDRIRWSALKKIIVDEKKICSERIFRETLNEMVDEGLVFRLELAKGNVVYSIDSGLEKAEKSRISYFNVYLKAGKENLNYFKKKMDKMSDTEKSDNIVSLLKIILLLEWGFHETFTLTRNPKIKNQISMLKNLKLEIMELIKEKKQKDVSKIIQKIIFSETIHSFIDLENKLYDKELKRFKVVSQK